MRGRDMALAVPALVAAMVSIQFGASLAKRLFPLAGPQGTVALRVGLAAIIVAALMRPWRARLTRANVRPLIAYGVSLGTMNLLFYTALVTVPLGVAVALEFTGPLAVALLSSRRGRDFAWIALAVLGLMPLLPLTGLSAVDPRGALLALAAGGCWALYIVFGQKAGAAHGPHAAALGICIAALLAVPVGVWQSGRALLNPAVLPLALAVAVLSSALPYSLEMVALPRLPARLFGTLMSLEPAVGALMGYLFLGERLTFVQMLAVAAVIAASMGMALGTREATPPEILPD